MKRLTKEEKAVVRAYLKMSISKNWGCPSEHEMSQLVNLDMTIENRNEMESFIKIEWQKLEKYKIGEKVIYQGFKCIITDLFVDCETGIEYASVKPLEFDSFEREAKISDLEKYKKFYKEM